MGVRLREKPKGSGRWQAVTCYQGRRRYSKIFPTKKEAEALARDLRKALVSKDYALPDPDAPTFQACAEGFLRTVRAVQDVRDSTHENYASFVTAHLLPEWGALKITDITAERVEAFIAKKRAPGGSLRFKDRPLAVASIRAGLQALGLILARAVRDKWLPNNPLTALGRGVLRRREDERDTVDPFTTAELRSILTAAEAIDADWATLLRVWAQTGARSGEVRGLQQQDVNVVAGTVTIRHTYTRKRLGPPKRGGTRTVSLLHPVTEATAQWRPGATIESRAVLLGLRRLKVTGLTPESFVFGGSAPLTPSWAANRWARTLRAAGVRFRNPEQLRHTFASTLLSRNAPLLYVQKQGGWKTGAVLLRTYSRWMPDALLPEAHAVESAPQARPGAEQVN